MSSPHYPQSNGHAESAVKSAKALVEKTCPTGNLDSDDFQLGLMELRNTPRSDGHSPAQLVFGQPLRSKLPLHFTRFAQQWKDMVDDMEDKATRIRERVRSHYDSSAKPLGVLKVKDAVRIQDPKTKRWTTIGEIIDIDKSGRSYTVRTEGGRAYRRNRRFLRRYYPSEDSTSDDPVVLEKEVTLFRRSSCRKGKPDRFQP